MTDLGDKLEPVARALLEPGEKLKLLMMSAEGRLGGLGAGETQHDGVEALGQWFAERFD